MPMQRGGRRCWRRPPFHPGRSGRNHLRTLAAAAGLRRRARRGGAGDRRPHGGREAPCKGGYSLGMSQRLGLAARAPRRPARCSSSTSRRMGSTRRASAGCATSCARSRAEGRTVLVSSHVLAEMAQTRRRRRDHRQREALVTQSPMEEVPRPAAGAGRGCARPSATSLAAAARARRGTARPARRWRRRSCEAPPSEGGGGRSRGGRRAARAGDRLGASLEEVFLELTGDGASTSVNEALLRRDVEAADDPHVPIVLQLGSAAGRAIVGGRVRSAQRERSNGRRSRLGARSSGRARASGRSYRRCCSAFLLVTNEYRHGTIMTDVSADATPHHVFCPRSCGGGGRGRVRLRRGDHWW